MMNRTQSGSTEIALCSLDLHVVTHAGQQAKSDAELNNQRGEPAMKGQALLRSPPSHQQQWQPSNCTAKHSLCDNALLFSCCVVLTTETTGGIVFSFISNRLRPALTYVVAASGAGATAASGALGASERHTCRRDTTTAVAQRDVSAAVAW
jgi:hypothetical protein